MCPGHYIYQLTESISSVYSYGKFSFVVREKKKTPTRPCLRRVFVELATTLRNSTQIRSENENLIEDGKLGIIDSKGPNIGIYEPSINASTALRRIVKLTKLTQEKNACTRTLRCRKLCSFASISLQIHIAWNC